MKKAFTLLELIISLSILSLLMIVAYKALSSITNTKQLIDDNRVNELAANSILTRLTRELQQVYNDNNQSLNLELMHPQTLPSKLYFKGERKGLSKRNLDSISFIMLNQNLFIIGQLPETHPVQITYRMEEDPEIKGNYLLIRDQIPLYNTYEESMAKKVTFPILDNIYSLKFKYFDENSDQWEERWDQTGATPKMIFLELKLISPLGNITTYSTIVITHS